MSHHTPRWSKRLALALALSGAASASACGAASSDRPPEADVSAVQVEILAPVGAECGVAAAVRIAFRPTRGLEFTNGYPIRLTVHGPGIDDVTEFRARDASVLRADEAAFVHAFQPTTGGIARFEGILDFSVCTATSCTPGQWPLSWEFPVTCDDLPQ